MRRCRNIGCKRPRSASQARRYGTVVAWKGTAGSSRSQPIARSSPGGNLTPASDAEEKITDLSVVSARQPGRASTVGRVASCQRTSTLPRIGSVDSPSFLSVRSAGFAPATRTDHASFGARPAITARRVGQRQLFASPSTGKRYHSRPRQWAGRLVLHSETRDAISAASVSYSRTVVPAGHEGRTPSEDTPSSLPAGS